MTTALLVCILIAMNPIGVWILSWDGRSGAQLKEVYEGCRGSAMPLPLFMLKEKEWIELLFWM